MHWLETIDLRGQLTLQSRDPNGSLITEVRANNSIVETGRELVAKLFMKGIKDTIKPVSHVAVGTGTNAVLVSDLTLGREILRKPLNAIDPQRDLQTIETDSPLGKVNRKKVILTADLEMDEANDALTEAALFTEDNFMYNRVVFKPINKTPDFKLTLIWEILF